MTNASEKPGNILFSHVRNIHLSTIQSVTISPGPLNLKTEFGRVFYTAMYIHRIKRYLDIHISFELKQCVIHCHESKSLCLYSIYSSRLSVIRK